jgi:hypothetical protein
MKHTPLPFEIVGATRIWRTGSNGAAVAIIAEPECSDSSQFNELRMGSDRWDEGRQMPPLSSAPAIHIMKCWRRWNR